MSDNESIRRYVAKAVKNGILERIAVAAYRRHRLEVTNHSREDFAQILALRLLTQRAVPNKPRVAWLKTVANNLAIDQIRCWRCRPKSVAITEPAADRQLATDEAAIDKEESIAIMRLLNRLFRRLSPKDRLVAKWFAAGVSQAEIARRMALTRGQVRAACSRVLREARLLVENPNGLDS